MKQLVIVYFSVFLFNQVLAQTQPRLVVPIGHNYNDISKFVSSDSTFLYTTETIHLDSMNKSLLIVWDLWSKKEVYRKEIKGDGEFKHLIFENSEQRILIFRGDVLHRINFEQNTHDTLTIPYTGQGLNIVNTALYIVGGKDSVSIFDLKKFAFIGKLNADLRDLMRWSSKNHQSGSFQDKSILLVHPKNANNFLLAYDPDATIPLRQLQFDFKIKKVFYLNSDIILIQKEILENPKESIYIYPFNLTLKTFLPPVPFHKYTINVFEYDGNGGLISSGNDGRLVFRDSTLKIIKEINVKKEFALPSFTKIQLSNNHLIFEASRKRIEPNQAEDSLTIKGLLDINSLKILHLDTILLNLPKSDEDEFFNSSRDNFLYGLDQSFSYLSNETGKIKVSNYFDTLQTEVLTITSDFNFDFKIISNDSINIEGHNDIGFGWNDFYKVLNNDTLPIDKKMYVFDQFKKVNSVFIQPDFIDQLQIAFLDEQNRWSKNKDKKWNLVSNSYNLDSVNYLKCDSLFYGKKLIFVDTLKTKENLGSSSLGQLNKHTLLVRTFENDSTVIFLLRNRNIKDVISLSSVTRIPNAAMQFYFQQNLKIPYKSFKMTFPDFPNNNELSTYFVTYPGKRLHIENSKNNSEFIDLQTQIKELTVSRSRFKIKSVDSIYKTDYLGLKSTRYLFDSPNNHLFYDYKQTKMWYNPGKSHNIISIDSAGIKKNYLFNSELTSDLLILPIYFTSHFNHPLSLSILNFLDEYHETHEYYLDREKNKIFSSSAQQYFGNELVLQSNEDFLGCFLDKQIFVVSDASNNFFHVRNFDNKQLFSFVILEGGQYLFFDEFFHFDGTPKAIEQLYLTCGLEIVELSQIKDAMYIPNLVQRILSGEDLSHLTKLSDISICGIAPKVLPLKSSNGRIRYKIIPQNGGIGTVEIHINGVLRKIVDVNDLLFQNGNYYLEIDPILIDKFKVDGQKSQVKIIARTKDSRISSRGVTIQIREENLSGSLKPSLHAIMVGIDSYKDQALALKYAAKDANDLQKLLEAAAKKYFNVDDTNRVFFYNLTLNNKGEIGTTGIKGMTPDRGNLIKTLEQIEFVSRPEDIVLLFFAGHGEIVDQNQFLLLTAESTRDNFQGLTMKEILDYMNKIPAGKRVLILDACHSGAAINNLDLAAYSGKRDVSDAERESQRIKELDKLARKSGFAIITASSSDQKAVELPQYEHGLLTFALLNAIVNSDNSLNDMSQLVLEKWFITAEDEMRKLNVSQNAEKMIPFSFNLGIVNEDVRQQIQMNKRASLFIDNVLNKETLADDFFLKSKLEMILQNKQQIDGQVPFILSASPEAISVNILYEQTSSALLITVKLKSINNEKIFKYESDPNNLVPSIEQISVDIINYLPKD